MKYKELRISQYEDYKNIENEYGKRINSFGTIKTKLFPYVYKNNETIKSQYPIFTVPLLEVQQLSQEIMENSRQIEKLAGQLPSVAHDKYYREQISKSIIFTNEIEGVHTTRKEVAEAFEAVEKSKKNVRLQSTINMYFDIMMKEKMSIENFEDIRAIYDGLTEDEIRPEDKPDGQFFRNQSVIVGKNHKPPRDEARVMAQLIDWIDFINNHEIPFLIRASLAHFFFENTHPFYDGNGRTGRYIFSRYLSKKLDKFSGLIISQKINENRKKYADAFEKLEQLANRSEGTFFVRSMLEFIRDGQLEIIDELSHSKRLLALAFQKIEAREISETEKSVLFLLQQSFLFTSEVSEAIMDNEIIELVHDSHSVSKKAVKAAIDGLEAREELVLISQRPKRHRLRRSISEE